MGLSQVLNIVSRVTVQGFSCVRKALSWKECAVSPSGANRKFDYSSERRRQCLLGKSQTQLLLL